MSDASAKVCNECWPTRVLSDFSNHQACAVCGIVRVCYGIWTAADLAVAKALREAADAQRLALANEPALSLGDAIELANDFKRTRESVAAGVCENCGTSWSIHDGPCGSHGELTDEHRLAVVRELWKLHLDTGRIDMCASLNEYERTVKERIGT